METLHRFRHAGLDCAVHHNVILDFWAGTVSLPRTHPDYRRRPHEIHDCDVRGGLKAGDDVGTFQFDTFDCLFDDDEEEWGASETRAETERLASFFAARGVASPASEANKRCIVC